MTSNFNRLTLGVACSAMLIFGSNSAFAVEYSVTDKIKVDFNVSMTAVALSSPFASFTHPDGTDVVVKAKLAAGETDEYTDAVDGWLNPGDYEIDGSKATLQMANLPKQMLRLPFGGDFDLTVSFQDSAQHAFSAKIKYQDWLTMHNKHVGSTHNKDFWHKANFTVNYDNASLGSFSFGVIESVFASLLHQLPEHHAYAKKPLNSVPFGIINTDVVTRNLVGMAWHHTWNDMLTLGATFKPFTLLAGEAEDKFNEDTYTEFGLAATVKLGGPELGFTGSIAYAADFPHEFATEGFTASICDANKVFATSLGMNFSGRELSVSYKYRASTQVLTEELTGAAEPSKFSFHEIEAGFIFKAAEVEWVTSEELKKWTLGARALLMFDTTEQDLAADADIFRSGLEDGETKYFLGVTKNPLAMQLDFSGKRTFNSALSTFVGMRFTYDQGAGMMASYSFTKGEGKNVVPNKDMELKPLNKLNVVLYAGITALFE